jgi:hypothetical protein
MAHKVINNKVYLNLSTLKSGEFLPFQGWTNIYVDSEGRLFNERTLSGCNPRHSMYHLNRGKRSTTITRPQKLANLTDDKRIRYTAYEHIILEMLPKPFPTVADIKSPPEPKPKPEPKPAPESEPEPESESEPELEPFTEPNFESTDCSSNESLYSDDAISLSTLPRLQEFSNWSFDRSIEVIFHREKPQKWLTENGVPYIDLKQNGKIARMTLDHLIELTNRSNKNIPHY